MVDGAHGDRAGADRTAAAVGFPAVLVGLALAITTHQQETYAVDSTQCWFSLSCDVEPSVLLARRVGEVAWTLTGVGLVLLTLRRAWGPGLTGAALVLLGATVRALALGDSVLPAVVGCERTWSCGRTPWWSSDPAFDLGTVALAAGWGGLVLALLLQLRRR